MSNLDSSDHRTLFHFETVHFKWVLAHRTRRRFWTMFTYGFLFAWESFSWHLQMAWRIVFMTVVSGSIPGPFSYVNDRIMPMSDAVLSDYTVCCAAWQIYDRKLLLCSIYDMLTQISNDFQRSLYRVQCRQTLAVALRRVRCRHGVTNLSRRTKATSASDRRPSAPWVLSSAGKLIQYLHGSYFLPYRSADVFLFCFFIRHLYLSVARLGCSLNALSST